MTKRKNNETPSETNPRAAGAPKKPETKRFTVRVPKEKYPEISAECKKTIDRICGKF